jgi:hypothetical protein
VDLIQSYLTLDGFVTVECQTCGFKVTCDFESTELAIEKWNRMTKGEKQMTNGEMFKTAEERRTAYDKYCKDCKKQGWPIHETFYWLDCEYIPPPETIPDIVAEIRKKHPAKEYPAEYGGGEVPNKMRKLADRIEAAWNRRAE